MKRLILVGLAFLLLLFTSCIQSNKSPINISNDEWKLSNNLWLLTSRCIDTTYEEMIEEIIGSCSCLGGQITYVYEKIPNYWDSIKQSNTLMLFNSSCEDISILSNCPEQYSEIIPLSEFNIEQPFALFKRSSNDKIRAIIVADNEVDILELVNFIIENQVPVNIPWTILDGQVVGA